MFDLITRTSTQYYLDKWIDDFIGDIAWNDDYLKATKWKPVTDISEGEKSCQINIEIPGVTKEDINVCLEDNILTISGEKKKEINNSYRTERFYGSFSRSFKLPNVEDKSQISAKFENGVLKITVPKLEDKKAERIQIE